MIILVKNKRPPTGYSYIGEVNSHSICIKFSQIPDNSPSHRNKIKSADPPPIPPRPYQNQSLNQDSIENDYIHINSNEQPSEQNHNFNTIRSTSSNQNSLNSNPLQGVPFEINPIYQSLANAGRKGILIVIIVFFSSI